MSNFDELQLEKALRMRADCEAKGVNPPPQLHVHEIAARYHISLSEVVDRLNAMRQPKDQP